MSKVPLTSEILILRHSKARVLEPSFKVFIRPDGRLSRPMSDVDVVVALSRKYGK